MNICPNCGAKGDFAYCPECGSKMETLVENKPETDAIKQEDSLKPEVKETGSEIGKTTKVNKKIIAIVGAIVAACIIFVIILTSVIIPTTKYNEAISLIDEGRYSDAYQALSDLNGFKDSNEKMKEISPQCNMEKIQQADVGDYVTFGAYPQSSSDYKEDVEWLVLDKKDGKLLLISKYALDARPYINPYETNIGDPTWETCWLRQWLNEDFIDTAFSSFEQSHIELSEVKAEKNTYSKTPPGNDTQDKIFIINERDTGRYFDSNEAMICQATEYAQLEGAIEKQQGDYDGCCWWLRTPGGKPNLVPTVWPIGGTDAGFTADSRMAVRPSLWLDPEL